MLPTRFTATFWNTLHTGRYHQPHLRGPASHTWLSLRRYGDAGELLEVSDAGPAPSAFPDAAPPELSLAHSLVAILTNATDIQAEFMFVRALPHSVTPVGIFFPADGHITLRSDEPTQRSCAVRVTALGRHFHSRRAEADAMTLEDVPAPGLTDHGGLTWAFDAQSVGAVVTTD